jgi:hypothetical protein
LIKENRGESGAGPRRAAPEEARPEKGERPDLIAKNLKSLFDGVAEEELPERFKTLLAKLAEREEK